MDRTFLFIMKDAHQVTVGQGHMSDCLVIQLCCLASSTVSLQSFLSSQLVCNNIRLVNILLVHALDIQEIIYNVINWLFFIVVLKIDLLSMHSMKSGSLTYVARSLMDYVNHARFSVSTL